MPKIVSWKGRGLGDYCHALKCTSSYVSNYSTKVCSRDVVP